MPRVATRSTNDQHRERHRHRREQEPLDRVVEMRPVVQLRRRQPKRGSRQRRVGALPDHDRAAADRESARAAPAGRSAPTRCGPRARPAGPDRRPPASRGPALRRSPARSALRGLRARRPPTARTPAAPAPPSRFPPAAAASRPARRAIPGTPGRGARPRGSGHRCPSPRPIGPRDPPAAAGVPSVAAGLSRAASAARFAARRSESRSTCQKPSRTNTRGHDHEADDGDPAGRGGHGVSVVEDERRDDRPRGRS